MSGTLQYDTRKKSWGRKEDWGEKGKNRWKQQDVSCIFRIAKTSKGRTQASVEQSFSMVGDGGASTFVRAVSRPYRWWEGNRVVLPQR